MFKNRSVNSASAPSTVYRAPLQLRQQHIGTALRRGFGPTSAPSTVCRASLKEIEVRVGERGSFVFFAFVIYIFIVQCSMFWGPKTGPGGSKRCLKTCHFILTEYGPVASHGDLIHYNFIDFGHIFCVRGSPHLHSHRSGNPLTRPPILLKFPGPCLQEKQAAEILLSPHSVYRACLKAVGVRGGGWGQTENKKMSGGAGRGWGGVGSVGALY